jgi:hypothetical protein
MLSELITLLTCDDMQGKELADAVSRIKASPMDPELDWLEGRSEAEYMQFAVPAELGGYFAMGDKIDELHEQINEQFADPLPEFPDGFWAAEYFEWLDEEIAARPAPFEALLWGNPFDDNLYVFIVGREDTARILELAGELGLLVEPATQRRLI